MAVLDLQHVAGKRVRRQAVDEVALGLEEPLGAWLPVGLLEVISKAHEVGVLLERVDADDMTTE